MYNKFASVYDELMNDFNYDEWFQYIEEVFKKYGKSPKKVLEMACGTGNLSYYFAENMYKLTAFDISDEMLSKAYNKLGRFKNVKILKQDMLDFNFNMKFDSIVAACDSMNYILELDDLVRVFQNVYDHLDYGGIFIFDISSYYKLRNILGNNIFIEDREDIYYSWENFFDEEAAICDMYLTFFLREGNLYERFDENHMQKAYMEDEILDVLERVGFKNNNAYEGFSFGPVQGKTERINFVSIK